MTPRTRTRFHRLASLFTALSLASCSGGTTSSPPPASEGNATPRGTPSASDTALGDAPADTAAVVLIDGVVLRANPLYAALRDRVAQEPVAVACGGDILATVDRATVASAPHGGITVVMRGSIADENHTACAAAMATALDSMGVNPEHIAGALVFATPNRMEILRATLEGGPNAGRNPQFVAWRGAITGQGLIAMLDMSAMERPAPPTAPFPGLDLPTTQKLAGSFHGGAFALTGRTDGPQLGVALLAAFDSHADAQEATAWSATQFGSMLGGARRMLAAPAGEAGTDFQRTPEANTNLLGALDRLQSGTHFTAVDAQARVTMDPDPATTGTLATLGVGAIVQYLRRAKATEAITNVARITQAAMIYGTEHASARVAPPPPRRGRRGATIVTPPPSPFPPSAARTPTEVPRGVRVVDPPEVWQTPTWQALGFLPVDPHYYSYEFVNQGDAFTVRAYGDLDGDGTLSTFERSGRIEMNGEVTVDPEVRRTDELE